jgi:hypothetical protein
VEDFAAIGEWVSRALGYYDLFAEGVNKVVIGQKSLAVESDTLLFDVIKTWVSRTGGNADWKTPEILWEELESCADGPLFTKKYQGAINLGKKLWVLQDTLRTMYAVSWRPAGPGRREWRIRSKGVNSEQG